MESDLSTRLSTEPIGPNGRDQFSALGALERPMPAPGHPSKENPPPLRSVHTSNFSAILQELGISVLVTTYQAGKLVMLRPDGERLNTHFRGFSKPMGLVRQWRHRLRRSRDGKNESLPELPGFTRGLDFCGPLAFIGLSQVRESAVFSGIAIAERPLAERCCGVWVVNIHTGQTVAYVKFEDALQEIFAVQVLPGVRHPDVINDQPRVIADSFVVPDEALDFVPGPLRQPARVTQESSMPEENVR